MRPDESPRPKELRIFGYRAHLTIDLEDGQHDISNLLGIDRRAEIISGWHLRADAVIREIDIEKRARARAKETAQETAHDTPGTQS